MIYSHLSPNVHQEAIAMLMSGPKESEAESPTGTS
jgi:hypothetical protein